MLVAAMDVKIGEQNEFSHLGHTKFMTVIMRLSLMYNSPYDNRNRTIHFR